MVKFAFHLRKVKDVWVSYAILILFPSCFPRLKSEPSMIIHQFFLLNSGLFSWMFLLNSNLRNCSNLVLWSIVCMVARYAILEWYKSSPLIFQGLEHHYRQMFKLQCPMHRHLHHYQIHNVQQYYWPIVKHHYSKPSFPHCSMYPLRQNRVISNNHFV